MKKSVFGIWILFVLILSSFVFADSFEVSGVLSYLDENHNSTTDSYLLGGYEINATTERVENITGVLTDDIPVSFSLTEEFVDLNVTDTDGNLVTNVENFTLQLRRGNVKRVEFSVSGDVNLSSVEVYEDIGKTVVSGLDSALGVSSAGHTLFVNNTKNAGVYVCPHANSLNDVGAGCLGLTIFNHTECSLGTVKGDFECLIDGDLYKVSGLTGSGIGEACSDDSDCDSGLLCISNICQNPSSASVPEFSSLGMLIVLVTVIVGVFMFRQSDKK